MPIESTSDLIFQLGEEMALQHEAGKHRTAGLLRRATAELSRLKRFEPVPQSTGCVICDSVSDLPPVDGVHVAGLWRLPCTRKSRSRGNYLLTRSG